MNNIFYSIYEDIDRQQQQHMVDTLAKRAGYTIGPVWHGTAEKFSVPEGWRGVAAHVTTDKNMAEEWGESAVMHKRDIWLDNPRLPGESETPVIYHWKVRGKMFDPRIPSNVAELSKKTGIDESDIKSGVYYMYEDNKDIIDTMKSMGYAGYWETEDLGNRDLTSLAVFEPFNIKSVDPFTYDNQNNIIPLDQRFNPENPDIRY